MAVWDTAQTAQSRARQVVLTLLAWVLVMGCFVLVARLLLPSRLYWTQPDQARMERDVASLDAVLPLLEELRVEEFRDKDWVTSIYYSGGLFSSDPYGEALWYDRVEAEFTDRARADFARVREALDRSGVWIDEVAVSYGDAGQIQRAYFDLIRAAWEFNGWSYVYAPGARPPADMPNEQIYVRISADWYFEWTEWM